MTEFPTNLPPEVDKGNTEYKLQLINLTDKRVEELRTQMFYRVDQGSGEAVYKIGVRDDGTLSGILLEVLEQSIENLQKIALDNFTVTEMDRFKTKEDTWFAYFLVREDNSKIQHIDLSIAVAGNVDSGKSTTIGVMTTGRLDNGRGRARAFIAKHPHEQESGRTSYVSHAYLGFDNKGYCLNDGIPTRKSNYTDVIKKSSKIITFYDMAGHEKYLRTTIAGFSSSETDYAIIIVGLNRMVTEQTIEHIGLCICFQIPFMILITKVDSLEVRHLVKATLIQIKKLIKSLGVPKVPVVVNKNTIMMNLADQLKDDQIVPILRISNVTGKNIQRLKQFLNLLPKRHTKFNENADDKDLIFSVREAFVVTGVGTVVSGFVRQGIGSMGQKVYIGPTKTGEYINTTIRSIHVKRMPTATGVAGQWVCFALKGVDRPLIYKGMVVISTNIEKKTVLQFTADVSIVRGHHITIKKGYEPVLNLNNLVQSARVLDTGKETILRANCQSSVNFRFIHTPCFISIGDKFVFREGKVCGSGVITHIQDCDAIVLTKKDQRRKVFEQLAGQKTDEILKI